jgi:hypothetical protein
VVFDRLRENLIKYKTMPLIDVMNLHGQRNAVAHGDDGGDHAWR